MQVVCDIVSYMLVIDTTFIKIISMDQINLRMQAENEEEDIVNAAMFNEDGAVAIDNRNLTVDGDFNDQLKALREEGLNAGTGEQDGDSEHNRSALSIDSDGVNSQLNDDDVQFNPSSFMLTGRLHSNKGSSDLRRSDSGLGISEIKPAEMLKRARHFVKNKLKIEDARLFTLSDGFEREWYKLGSRN